MNRIIFFFLMLSLCWSASAQGVISLSGQVYDKQTGEPLRAASVTLQGSSLSIVTNSEGVFTFKIPASSEGVITVSYLGYLTAEYQISDFAGGQLRIPMIPYAIQLEAAKVSAHDAYALVLSALMRIRDNYPTEHVGMTAFYRELIKKGGIKYIVLNEAVIDIDKAPYYSVVSDKAAIYKGRGNLNYDASDSLAINFQGGIVSALNYDQVHDPFAGVSLRELDDTYDFSLEPPVLMDDKLFQVVRFDQKPGSDDILYRGRIFIESETLAIARVELNVNVEGREERAAGLFVLRQPANLRTYINRAEVVMNYKEFDGKWYYDYIRMSLDLSTRRRRSLFRTNYYITGEMAVTDHRDGRQVVVENTDRVRFRDILSQKVSAFTDTDFWGDYNVIEPDQDINAIVRRIIRQLNRRHESQ